MQSVVSRVAVPLTPDWSLVGKIQVVAVDRLWEHIPIVGLMIVENKRCGECLLRCNKTVKNGYGEHEVEIETWVSV
ncbi:hypothetical protein Tco_0536870 [Tanacetum coccineum]